MLNGMDQVFAILKRFSVWHAKWNLVFATLKGSSCLPAKWGLVVASLKVSSCLHVIHTD